MNKYVLASVLYWIRHL